MRKEKPSRTAYKVALKLCCQKQLISLTVQIQKHRDLYKQHKTYHE